MNVLLIDISSIFWATWFGAAGQPIDFTYDCVVGRVRRLGEARSGVVVCCDSGPSFRIHIAADYKANRPQRDVVAYEQMKRVQETLALDGFPMFSATGFEADDLIATVTEWAAKRDDIERVVIATGDKDLSQLVRETPTFSVSILSTQTGKMVGPAEVEEKYGVPPKQMRDWLCLVGDKSDNVRGVQGIGKVHATALLKAHKDLPGILKAAMVEQSAEAGKPLIHPPSIRAAIIGALGHLDQTRELVTLRTDCPCPFEQILAERVQRPLTKGSEDPWGKGYDDGSGEADESGDFGASDEEVARAVAAGEALPLPENMTPSTQTTADAQKSSTPHCWPTEEALQAARERAKAPPVKGAPIMMSDVIVSHEDSGASAEHRPPQGANANGTPPPQAPTSAAADPGSGGAPRDTVITRDSVVTEKPQTRDEKIEAAAVVEAKEQAAEKAKAKPRASTEMAVVLDRNDPRWALALEPRHSGGAMALAEMMFNSRLFSAYGNKESILAVMLMGRARGLDSMTALAGMHIIKGKAVMSAQLMVGLVMSSGKCEYFELVEADWRSATYATKRVGGRREIKMRYSIEDAERARLLKIIRKQGEPDRIEARSNQGEPLNWEKDPGAMCIARATSRLVRAAYQDIAANTYTPDELRDDVDGHQLYVPSNDEMVGQVVQQ